MISYDSVEWHLDHDFPQELPKENSATHIGMFMTWAIERNLISKDHKEDARELIEKVRKRDLTGRDFLIMECDDKLFQTDLNKIGNEFAMHYYRTEEYLKDYQSVFEKKYPSFYHVENNWSNYEQIKEVIEDRFKSWEKSKSSKWKFWK